MINRNHLALFNAVVEEGGFGRAARKLRISQPAVSIQISQLEAVVGARLFDRVGRGIRLTDAGQVLSDYARRIAALEREADHAMQEITAIRQGRLRVGASTTIGAYLLPQLFSMFRRQWPLVTLEMVHGNSATIQQHLMDGLIDLGLVEGKKFHQDLSVQAFREDQLVPVVAWDHPLAKARKLTLRQFLKYPLILREQGSGTRDTVLDYIGSKSQSAASVLEFGSNEAVRGAVAAGLGVSIVSSLTVPGDVMLKRIKVVELLETKAIRRPFYALQFPGRTQSPSVAAFLSILRNR